MTKLEAVTLLQHACQHLAKTYRLDVSLRVNNWPLTAEFNACRILVIAICDVEGTTPHWIKILKYELKYGTKGATQRGKQWHN